MPYRMVTNFGKLCGRLAGAATKHAERIVSSLTERWSDRLEEGEELTVTKMLSLLAEDLLQVQGRLATNENQLRSEISADKQDRGVRNRSMSDLRELLFDVKKVCDAHYGPGSAETLFQEDSEDVPVEANEVYRLADRVRSNMRNPEFSMPPLKHGIAPDFAALAGRFDQPLALLSASLRGLDVGGQGSSAAIADKELNFDEAAVLAGRAGRFLESITFLAGQEGVARRIRQSRHRARAGDGEAEEPEAEEEAEAADSADGETPEDGEPPPAGPSAAGETTA